MLFSVKYIEADIAEFHEVVVYFFRQLETNNHVTFTDSLFPENVRLKLYKYGNEANGYKKFIDSFKEIFLIYTAPATSAEQKQKIIDDFFASNNIDEICNDINLYPVHYDDMNEIEKSIASFFNAFYDSYFQDLSDKSTHFQKFGYENGKICPVCGLETSYQYDHFVPKGSTFPVYPLSSVNPRNLIPICQACNGPKSSRLIIYENNNRANPRVLSFSPYNCIETWQNLNFEIINIVKPGVNTPGEWSVTFTPIAGLPADQISKIDTWKNFFNIEDRFSREIEKNIKIWILEFKINGKTFEEMVANTVPNIMNIRRINGVLLQNLLFNYIAANDSILDQFVNAASTAENPSTLLFEQEGN